MNRDGDDFLSRWSRRKREAAARKAEPQPPAQPKADGSGVPAQAAGVPKAADLPPVESLTFDSDFAAYLRANVDESVKRAALKKLLHDPRFNVMDGLDTYIDDYSINDPIPDEMMKTLEHARTTLFGPRSDDASAQAPRPEAPQQAQEGEAAQDAASAQPQAGKANDDPRQDT